MELLINLRVAQGRTRKSSFSVSSTGSTSSSSPSPEGGFSPCPPDPSHLPSFFVARHGDSEDVWGFLHDSDQQVVDVILELPHLQVLPGDGILLFQHQLDQLIVCQLSIGIGRL